jgi:type I restriction enzyme, S subunit
MTAAIDITKEQRKTLLALLRRFIPGVAVWTYGSRVKWTARPNSDLDLVAFTTPAQSPLVSELKEVLAESDLPFLVDFHVWDEVPKRFHEIIRKEYVVLQEAEQQETGSDMAGGWVTRKLRECCDFNPSSIKPDWPHRSLHYIDISSVGEGFQTEPPKLFLRSEAPSRAQRLVAPGDCLLSTVRPNRRSMLWLGSVADDVVASTGFAVLRAKPGVIFSRYLYYTVFNQAFTDYLVTREKGAAYPAVSTADIGDAEIALPPLHEQKAIAHILGALDDKIELNRRMNATLEAMARALFQSWFVDFDPVRAKLDGRKPANLDAATAALFPAHFQESLLGHIPQGWEVKTIEELAERVAMGPFGSVIKISTFVPEGIPVISGQHLRGTLLDDSEFNFVTEEHADRLKRSNVQRGDVIFTHAGSIGQVAYIPETSRYERYIISQRQFYMRCNRSVMSPFYIASYFKTPEGQHRLLANTSSTGVPSISQPVTYLRQLKMVVPPPALLKVFDATVSAIHLNMAHNDQQSRTLATLRDALLPKLLSGELRVKDVMSINAMKGMAYG